MFEYKLARFFGIGAVFFIATSFFGKIGDNRVMIAGLIFAGLALLCVNIGNIKRRRERTKTRLKNPKKY